MSKRPLIHEMVCNPEDFCRQKDLSTSHNDCTAVYLVEREGKTYFQKRISISCKEQLIGFMREVFLGIFCESPVILGVRWFGLKSCGSGIFRGTIITDYCEKGSLCDRFKSRKQNNTKKTTMAFEAYLGAWMLTRLHVRHRDLKPHNFVVTADDRVKLCDFGACKPDASLQNSIPWSTPVFSAPEGKDRELKEYGVAAEVYSMTYVITTIAGMLADLNGVFWRCDLSKKSEEYANKKKMTREQVDMIIKSRDVRESRRPCFTEIVDDFCEGKLNFDACDSAQALSQMRERRAEVERCVDSLLKGDGEWLAFPSILEMPRPWAAYLMKDPRKKAMGAYMFHFGILVDRDDVIALKILRRCDYRGDMIDRIRNSGDAYSMGCYLQVFGSAEEAVKVFTRGMRNGCKMCLTQLGILLLSGADNSQKKGVKLLDIAVKAGDRKAALFLGLYMYKKNMCDEALRYLSLARDRGSRIAETVCQLLTHA